MPPYFQTLHTTQSFNMLFTDAQITSDRTIRNYYAQDMFIVIKRENSETNCSKYINDAQIYWSWTFWHLPHCRLYFRSPWIPGRSVQQNWPHMALGRTGWLCRPLNIKKPVRLNIAVMGTGKKVWVARPPEQSIPFSNIQFTVLIYCGRGIPFGIRHLGQHWLR